MTSSTQLRFLLLSAAGLLLFPFVLRGAAALHPDKVVVVPPIVHGHSPHHMDFPGTLTVDPQHMINYVLDVCLSLSHHVRHVPTSLGHNHGHKGRRHSWQCRL